VRPEAEPADPPPARRTFESLSVRNYRIHFAGQAAASTGKWVQNLALSWYALQLGGSAVVLGLIIACRYAPSLLLGPWGGLVVDRRGQRAVMVATQVFGCVLSLAFAAVTSVPQQPLVILFLLTTAVGIWDIFDVPARQSIIPSLVPERLLGNAVALNSITNNATRGIGPAIAGVVIVTLGVSSCMMFNALCQLLSLAAVLALRTNEMTLPDREKSRARGQVRAGLRYVSHDRALLVPLVMVTVTGLFTWEYPVTLPILMTSTFGRGADAVGAATACLGAGALAGSLYAARHPVLTMQGLARWSIAWGISTFAVGLSPVLGATYVLLALAGAFAVLFNSVAKSLLQLRCEPHFRGRVMALWFMAWQGSTVLGAPLVGLVAHLFGGRSALLLGGVAATVIGVVYLRPPGARAPDRW
jgi:MFS family permease